MQNKWFRIALAWMLALPLLCFFPAPVKAQGISAGELIDAVNAMRAGYGLAPYQVDSYWMSVAQEHSEYMASINSVTHLRADGTGPGDHQISSENISGGYSMTAQVIINSWSDYWHTFTLIGFSSGLVGAGVATGDDGFLYYTLVVKNTGSLTGLPDEGSVNVTPGSFSTGQPTLSGQPAATGESVPTAEPLMTATPHDDGSVWHAVAAGQTLWEIAMSYDVSVDALVGLNDLDAANPVIYPGETILIQLGYTATPTATITNTPPPPTRTLRPSRTPQPTRLTGTPAPNAAGSEAPLLPDDPLINRENVNLLGIVTIVVAVLGAGALIFGRIWSKKHR